MVYVHRLAAHLFLNFDLDSELAVCHHCDTPDCWEHTHLFIGTQAENVHDMHNKNRGKWGREKAVASHKSLLELRRRLKDAS